MKKMLEESKTKTEIIKMLSENVNTITIAYRVILENKMSDTDKLDTYEQRTTSDDLHKPRRSLKSQIVKTKLPIDDSNTTNKNPSKIPAIDINEI